MTTLNPRTVNTLRQLVEALYDAPREVQPGRTLLVVTDDLGAVLGDLPMLLLALNTAKPESVPFVEHIAVTLSTVRGPLGRTMIYRWSPEDIAAMTAEDRATLEAFCRLVEAL